VAGGALLLFMVLTGRVHVLTAAVAALIPLLRKLPALLKLAPLFRRNSQFSADDRSNEEAAGSGQERATVHNELSEQEACEVLGVQQGCSREDIIAAHRRLIQKLHPDRGGNHYLAAKINEAKSVLLGKYQY
jgi:hypothetical protein